MDEKEKMLNGELYFPNGDDILEEQFACLELLYDYNQTRPSEGKKREALLKKMFAELGEHCYVEPPLRANWGGHHVHFGDYVYANFNLTLVDDTHIYVGHHTMFGPNVTVATAGIPFCLRSARSSTSTTYRSISEITAGSRRIHHPPRGDHRGQHRDRSRERRDQGYSGKRSGSRESLPGLKGDRRTGLGILLPGQEDPGGVSGFLRKETAGGSKKKSKYRA